MIKVKRAYEPPSRRDGYRVLVDRLWPRGLRKKEVPLDDWAKELSPSSGLRRWFGHDASRWREFVARYRQELRAPRARELLSDLARRAEQRTVTLVYGARDEVHNEAVVLRDKIARRIRRRAKGHVRRAAG